MFDSKGGTRIESIRNKYQKASEPKFAKNDLTPGRSAKKAYKYIDSEPVDVSPSRVQQQKQLQVSRPERTGKIFRNPTHQKQNQIKSRFSMEKLPAHQDYISVSSQNRIQNITKLHTTRYRKQQADLTYRTQRSIKKRPQPTHRLDASINVKNTNLPQPNMDSLECIKKIQQVQLKIKNLLFSH